MKTSDVRRCAILFTSLLALSACQDGQDFLSQRAVPEDAIEAQTGGKMIERDVEAPEVFQASDKGLWDGRPSLGGVWVAHSSAKTPERVLILNTENEKSIVGALFKRDVTTPGPDFQVSSDAAEALGMLAGAPVALKVTALRREEVPVPEPKETPDADQTTAEAGALAQTETISTTPLDDPIASAAAALDEIDAKAKAAAPANGQQALPRPYLQVATFQGEANAKTAAEKLKAKGFSAEVRTGKTSSGKTVWRVLVGPSASKTDQAELLKKVKASGFKDAYPVAK